MNDEELKALFARVDDTPAEDARDRAVAAALAAFDEADNLSAAGQGSGAAARPTPEHTPIGRKIMNMFTANDSTRRWLFSGMASAAVLVLGLFLALQMPQQGSFEYAWDAMEEQAPGGDAQPTARAKEYDVAGSAGKVALDVSSAGEAQEWVAAPPPATPAPEVQAQRASYGSEDTAQSAAGLAMEKRAIADDRLPGPRYRDEGRDRFTATDANPVKRVAEAPVSTFSIDVDTASYSFVRRQLNSGVLPQKSAVRLEEMVNYFPYDYPLPADRSRPFSTSVTVTDSPWKAGNRLVHIGIKGYELAGTQPRANLVFLLDVSGSMRSPDKLPLVKQSMNLLLSKLQPEDTVSIVVYAGAAGTVLEPTPVSEKQKILAALNRLQAGGSTAGAQGIQLAYQLARAHFIKDGVNRVVLATDGDFNVGITSQRELQDFVERERKSGVFLSVLGFGQGNYNDALMQALAQNGNGVAAYIDSLSEAQKVLVDEATSSLFTIARDVKIQVEFNPATVSEYRLLGYETRLLKQQDFNNDAVDAGDIGAGHSVTAIYEITPTGSDSGLFSGSRYTQTTKAQGKSGEYGFLKLRYKLPGEDESRLIEQPITLTGKTTATAQREANFATAVAGFAQLLEGGQYIGSWNYDDALQLAQANRGDDPYGYRAELVQLIRKAETASSM